MLCTHAVLHQMGVIRLCRPGGCPSRHLEGLHTRWQKHMGHSLPPCRQRHAVAQTCPCAASHQNSCKPADARASSLKCCFCLSFINFQRSISQLVHPILKGQRPISTMINSPASHCRTEVRLLSTNLLDLKRHPLLSQQEQGAHARHALQTRSCLCSFGFEEIQEAAGSTGQHAHCNVQLSLLWVQMIAAAQTGKHAVTCAPCAGVHVPVEDVCGRGIAQGAIGDQLHVRVSGLDGKVEGYVVSYVGRVPTVLVSTKCSWVSASSKNYIF